MLDFDVDDPLNTVVLHGSYLVQEFSSSSVATTRVMGDQEVVRVNNYHVEEVEEESECEFFSENEDERAALSNGKEGRCEKKEQKGDEKQHEGGQETQDYHKKEIRIQDREINRIDYTQQQQKTEQCYQKVKKEEDWITDHDTDQKQHRPERRHQQQPIPDFNEKAVEEKERITVHTDGCQETEATSQFDENKAIPEANNGPANTDGFHMNYAIKMKELDRLNLEWLHALGTLLNTPVEDPTFLFNLKLQIKCRASNSYMFGQGAYNKYLLRQVISGLELVYVGQSCLSWEALQHQYHSVETHMISVPGAVFNGTVAENFQYFSTSLWRFIENATQEKWVWNYVKERRSNGNFLQVPEVSGYTEVDGEATRAEQLLMKIIYSIQIFHNFLRANNDKPLLELSKLFKLDSQVENPNDIGLFHRLCKEASKKKRRLEDFAKGKNRWRRRSVTFRDTEAKVILFSMIDLELASRVLQMFVISTRQLQWCEERLNSVQIFQGRLVRNPTGSSFPVM